MKFCLSIALLFFATLAQAGAENPNLLPFGETEGLRGNTGVAGGGSTGAVFYNPAALAELEHPRLAISGSTYYQYHVQSDSLAHFDGSDLPYSASAFNAVPSTVISTMSLGDWTVGYFLLVPETLKLDNKVSWLTNTTHTTVLQNEDRGELWVGIAGGKKIARDLAVGFSLFGIRHTSTDSSASMVLQTSAANTGGFSMSRLQTQVYGVALMLGALYYPAAWCTLGLHVRSPLLHVAGSGSLYSNTQSLAAGVLTSTEDSQDDFRARYQMPIEVALGARFEPIEGWWVDSDVSWQAGAGYDTAPGIAYASHIDLRPMARYNLGTELTVRKDVVASAGFAYNPSTVTPGSGFTLANFYVFSSGLSIGWERSRFSMGAFYSWSTQTPAGSPSDLKTTVYGGLLSAGYLL